MRRWHQPEWMQKAALLHSAYGTELGTAWDKRLTFEEWHALVGLIEDCARSPPLAPHRRVVSSRIRVASRRGDVNDGPVRMGTPTGETDAAARVAGPPLREAALPSSAGSCDRGSYRGSSEMRALVP